MNVQDLSRTYVRTWLKAARIPVSAASRVAGKGDDWAPAAAFDGFGGAVKQLVGSLTRDDTLAEEGRLERAKVRELRRAVELESEAEVRRRRAQDDARRRSELNAERRAQAERDAEAKERSAEAEKAAAKRQIAQETARKEEAARKADKARADAVANQERAARAVTLQAETEAVRNEREALESEVKVEQIDKAIEATKAVRKNKAL